MSIAHRNSIFKKHEQLCNEAINQPANVRVSLGCMNERNKQMDHPILVCLGFLVVVSIAITLLGWLVGHWW